MKPQDKKLFPQKLWDLVHDERFNFCLRWSQDGQKIYLERDEFEANYLRSAENQFNTQNILSFVRQMNLYGFKKVDECYYENDYFKRDHYNLLQFMTRHPPARPTSIDNRTSNQWDIEPLSSPEQICVAQVASGLGKGLGGGQPACASSVGQLLQSPGTSNAGGVGVSSIPVDYSRQLDCSRNPSRRKQPPVKFVSRTSTASSPDSLVSPTANSNLNNSTTNTLISQPMLASNLLPSQLDAMSKYIGLDGRQTGALSKRRAKSDLTPQRSSMSLELVRSFQCDLSSCGSNEPNVVGRNQSVPSTLNEQQDSLQLHGIQPAPSSSSQSPFMDQQHLNDSLKILLESLSKQTDASPSVDQLPPSVAGGSSIGDGTAAISLAPSSNLNPCASGPSSFGWPNGINPDVEFILAGSPSSAFNTRNQRANDSRPSFESYLSGLVTELGGSMTDASITGPSGLGFPKHKRGMEVLDDNDDDHDDNNDHDNNHNNDDCYLSSFPDTQSHNCKNRTRKSSYRRSSSSLSSSLIQSRRLEELQDNDEDSSDFILDLAKPKMGPSSNDKEASDSGGTS